VLALLPFLRHDCWREKPERLWLHLHRPARQVIHCRRSGRPPVTRLRTSIHPPSCIWARDGSVYAASQHETRSQWRELGDDSPVVWRG